VSGSTGPPIRAPDLREPWFVGRAVAALAADPDIARRNGQALSAGALARE